MFSVNKGTRLLPVLVDGSAKNGQSELYASASLDEGASEVIVKLVNTGSTKKEARITLGGAQRVGPGGKAFLLQSEDLKTENSLDHPIKLAPVEKQLQVSGGEFSYELLPRSFTVLRIPLK
jgi:alpha-L-arabinofuranosidase